MNSTERLEDLKQSLEQELDRYGGRFPDPGVVQAYALIVMALTKTYGLV